MVMLLKMNCENTIITTETFWKPVCRMLTICLTDLENKRRKI